MKSYIEQVQFEVPIGLPMENVRQTNGLVQLQSSKVWQRLELKTYVWKIMVDRSPC